MEVAGLFAGIIFMLLIGVPIAVSLGLCSIMFLLLFSESSLASIAQTLFQAMAGHYTLLAIPFFILASSFMSTGGVAKRIIRFSIALVGHFPGGLAIAGVFACMLFAALSGSSPATVVAIGTIVITGMRKVGYSKDFAAGVICNAGTLGILIPPSIVMVVYASTVEVSVSRMFLAGVIPGIVAGLMLMIGIFVVAVRRNLPRGDWLGWHEVLASGKDALWGLFLIIIILGGIYGGTFTPTEAAAVASVYAFFAATIIYRDMGPLKGKRLIDDSVSTARRNGYYMIIYGLLAALLARMIVGSLAGEAAANWAAVIVGILAGLGYGYLREGNGLLASLGQGCMLALKAVMQFFVYIIPAIFHKDTRETVFEAGKLTTTLLFIIANALILKHVLTDEQIPQHIASIMLDAGLSWWMFLIVVNLILLIGGQFMEPSGLIVIVAPLVFPIAIEMGIDPIHLGIIMVVNMEIGMITPPVGLNLFVTSGVAGMPMWDVVKAATPWLAILFVFLIMVTYVPWLSTLMPNYFMGPEIITK